jgi:hypothetical protein
MDYPTEKYLLINPENHWPEKAIWNGLEYDFDYVSDWHNGKGESIVSPNFPMIKLRHFEEGDPRSTDPADVQQAAWNYIKAMYAVYEKAEKYDDLMGSGNA